MAEFIPWPKIHRLNREIIVTEKIDGTNACIVIGDDGEISAQSRTRAITPEQDNAGFARWVSDNAGELSLLGPGYHFGEWYGRKIQRGYGPDDKRFMLFNVDRWADAEPTGLCEVSTVLFRGDFEEAWIRTVVDNLRVCGSVHVPGWEDPEGIVVYHTQGNVSFKVTCVGDEKPKGQVLAEARG